MNRQLKSLFDKDQRDCLNQPPDGTPKYKALKKRCRLRIARVKSIIKSNRRFTGEDYFHMCIIFMHGTSPDDFWQSYNFGLKSIENNYKEAKRFAAAAYDKWLMYQGKPQKFGLQYVPDGIKLRVWDIDPKTTDEERAEWDVPPLRKLYEIAEEATKNYDMSTISMETKPQWLKDAIKRWKEV